ncbi:endolytic transglycosylase MltG [Pontibaca methylaminivorans]|uniref:Endolytic murein transglycosylase n=1 Tax=Pontibaca methylaminivorans TaxID=515897 RepID=A0A1R3WBU1_9RHOB|nr:endolytic transglycosylase MltG [Pontibaca methylaminivorans]SIT75357.1 UPF0755 protein [Pontibaca methylaminivorans]
MWRSIASNMVSFLIIVLLAIGGVILWGKRQYTTEGPLAEAICLRVERGANIARVSRDLAEQGAVRHPSIFRIGAGYTEKADKLKAGSFLIRPGASMDEIMDEITRGGASTCGTEIIYRVGVNHTQTRVRQLDPAEGRFVELVEFDTISDEAPEEYAEQLKQPDTRYRIALAEGVTNWQVVEALKAIDILEGEVGELPPEGHLAPDSYDAAPGMERAALLDRMQQRQELRIAAAWEGREEGLPYDSADQMLIMASIIEKETGVPQERGQVASVFVNRLERGMRLQTDPTVIYGITNGKGVLGRGLRQSELRKATPWNTYVIEGLPETPIANPGVASLEAAVAPEKTDYLFFVADGTGGHSFAATLDEHNRNVANWRRIEAESAGE